MRVEEKDITISVFEINNNEFRVIGQVNQYTSLRWVEEYADVGSFELWAPITEENAELFKHDRIIWIEGEDTAGIIEGIKETIDINEQKVYDITGRMLNSLLDRRIVWNTYNAYNKKVNEVLMDIVDENYIHNDEELSNRDLPFFGLGSYTITDEWGRVTIQRTGDEVLSVLQELSAAQECGFDVSFYPNDNMLYFNVIMGENHTIGSDNPVVLSSSMEDILESTYYSNKKDYKNVALVAGEGEGERRVRTTAGDDTLSGYDRRELYVDARDLQKDENDYTVKESDLEEYTYDKDEIDNKIVTYDSMSSQEAIAGTSTTAKVISAKVLADALDDQFGRLLNATY